MGPCRLSANTPHAEERRAPLILLVTRDAFAADLWLARAEGLPHVAPGAPMAIEATALDATSPPQVVGERMAARARAVSLLVCVARVRMVGARCQSRDALEDWSAEVRLLGQQSRVPNRTPLATGSGHAIHRRRDCAQRSAVAEQ